MFVGRLIDWLVCVLGILLRVLWAFNVLCCWLCGVVGRCNYSLLCLFVLCSICCWLGWVVISCVRVCCGLVCWLVGMFVSCCVLVCVFSG